MRKGLVECVYVRDYEKQKVCSDWVRAFSQSPDARELLLRDIQVFDWTTRRPSELILAVKFPLPAAQSAVGFADALAGDLAPDDTPGLRAEQAELRRRGVYRGDALARAQGKG